MKIVRTVLNIILSFLLIFGIFSVIITSNLENKILNKNYVFSKLEEAEVYLQISREVQSGFENYIYQSGLPENTIENLYDEDLLKEDVNSIINYIYDGTEIKISTEKVLENLDKRINEYIESQDIKLNNQGKSNIKKFENLIIDEYENNVNASELLYEKAHSGIKTLNTVSEKIGKIPMIFTIAIIVLLILINIKDLLVAINYLGITSLSSGILMLLGTNLILKRIDFDNLLIFAKSISSLITSILKDILYSIQDNAYMFIVAGIVAILITAILKNIGNSKE